MRLSNPLRGSLFARIALILLAGLLASQAVSLWLNRGERTTVVSQARGFNLAVRIADSVRILLDHPNRVLNRDQLTEMIHGREADAFDRAIDVQVSRLRQRLRDDSREPTLIKTVRGEGYVLAASVEGRSECA